MGYGARALNLLKDYYEFKITNLDEVETTEIDNVDDEDVNLLEETIEPRKSLPPLLLKLSERPPEKLHYLGVSYGLTEGLLKFWKRSGFVPVYLRQTTNDLTGEHSCIMLNVINDDANAKDDDWLKAYWIDFRKRFVSLLSYNFKTFSPAMSLSMLTNKARVIESKGKINIFQTKQNML